MKRLTSILALLALLIVPASMTLAGPNHPHHPHKVRIDQDGRGYLGVSLTFVNNTDVGKEDNGVYINKVFPASGAEAAGLKAHDRIVAIDGVRVAGYEQLHQAMGETRPDDRITLTVDREGREQTLSVTLGQLPQENEVIVGANVHKIHGEDGRWAVIVDRKGAFLGLHIQELGTQLADYFQVEGGLLITEVIEDGPAAQAGLQAGDILTEVAGHATKKSKTLHQLLSHFEAGEQVEVRVERRGAPMTFFVEAGSHEGQSINLDLQHLHKLIGNVDDQGNYEVVIPDSSQTIHVHRPHEDDGEN